MKMVLGARMLLGERTIRFVGSQDFQEVRRFHSSERGGGWLNMVLVWPVCPLQSTGV